ncbi:MAG: transcription-repair coupling factor [Firmicutes bacterium]|nr:transcription-repair coupling factor [Bacillota bacterium]
MKSLIALLEQSASWEEIQQALANKQNNLLVSGVSGSAKSFLGAGLKASQGGTLLYIAPNSNAAEQVFADMQTLLPEENLYFFPARENPLYGIAALSPELMAERQKTLYALSSGEPCLVVSSWDALFYRLPVPSVFSSQGIELFYGQQLALADLTRLLVQGGYERVPLVEHPGQYSQRGGIIDIYGPGYDWPVRIEFFGDEIDLIKQFDLTSQRSLANVERVLVLPAQESVWPESANVAGLQRLETALAQAIEANPSLASSLTDHVGADLERLQAGLVFPGRERYLPFFLEEDWSLLDYLPPTARVIIDEPTKVWEQAEADYKLFMEGFTGLLEEGRVLPAHADIVLSPEELLKRLPRGRTLFFSLFPRRPAPWRIDQHVSFLAKGVQSFHGQSAFLRQETSRLLDNDYRVVIMSGDSEGQERMLAYLREEGLTPLLLQAGADLPPAGTIAVAAGHLVSGFEFPDMRLCVFAAGDIMQRLRPSRRVCLSQAEGARLANYRDLNVGDYVVHVHHGIGQYLGITTLEIGGLHRDYLQIKYAGKDKLYVPTDQIDLLQKYVGAEGRTPKIYSLGGGDWQKVKSRVKKSVQEMAKELLALYAARENEAGFSFPPDDEWQQQMEARFPYRETDDQLRAITDIKADMESPKPMDRLLCGDVGYGKTEIAVRAAFKAATAGKQVAVLVPTTILAEQHYNTFKERFAGFPLELGLLSRFRSPAANRETVRRLAQGLVDVVIGTHRLLQSDVKFWDLGLLIIDEEQRFGVKHKERLKMLKQNVDTLTLTATPIPRTLHMALVGMRDMSVIETPPEDRFPVQTYVVEHNDELVRNAIRRELQRQGQVYYVHNRVRSIRRVASRLAELVPEARIAYGHGQMSEERLERLVLDFVAGEYDVLVTTTIIESGLDIPNVNTMIVEDADKFGLAQLYQLRGRVGRSNRVAFAYFTYRPQKSLSEVAEKRLQAIKEFTELGAGFKIAMRDLEIRGAGNILGPEQHGFMVAVGFDLYCQLLEEAVRELKGQAPVKKADVELDLSLDAFIPDRYIRDGKQKVEMYKKIRAATELADVDDIEDEMFDRYGNMPESVRNLLLATRMRVLAQKLDIGRIVIGEDSLQIQLAAGAYWLPEQIEFLYRQTEGQMRLQPNKPGVFVWRQTNTFPVAMAKRWVQLMTELVELMPEGEKAIG